MNIIGSEKRDGAARTVTAAAFVSIFVYSFVMSLSGVIVNEIIDAFSLRGASQGLMGSMLNLGCMAALVITPLVQGRVGKLTMMIFACGMQSVMLLAGGLSPSFSLFCASYVLLGIGGSFADAYSNSSIADVRKDDCAKYMGLLHGLFGVGSLIAPLMIYRLMLLAGWRGVHYFLSAVMAAAAIAVFFLSRGTGQKRLAEATLEHKLSKSDLLEYMREKRNVLLLLAAVFASATQTGILMWILRYMTLRFDAAELGALAISVYWVCATINRFCVGRIKAAPMKLFICGALLCAMFVAAGVLSASPAIMCVLMGAMGFVSGHFMPVLFGEFAAGYEGRTTFTTSVAMFVMGMARIAVPPAMAYISAYISVATGMLLPAVMAVLAAGFGFLTSREDSKRARARR